MSLTSYVIIPFLHQNAIPLNKLVNAYHLTPPIRVLLMLAKG